MSSKLTSGNLGRVSVLMLIILSLQGYMKPETASHVIPLPVDNHYHHHHHHHNVVTGAITKVTIKKVEKASIVITMREKLSWLYRRDTTSRKGQRVCG